MFRKSWIIILLISSIFFSACQIQPAGPRTPTPVRSTWLNDFLAHPSCQLPCWNGITPGITSYEEARKILLEDTNLKVTQETEFKGKGIEWDFLQDGSGGMLNNWPRQEHVQIIVFYLAKDQWLPLSDLLAAHPNPSSISFRASHSMSLCELYIFYESLGMLVASGEIPCEAKEKDGTFYTKIKVTPATMLQYIHLYTKVGIIQQALLDKVEWKGYGEYVKDNHP